MAFDKHYSAINIDVWMYKGFLMKSANRPKSETETDKSSNQNQNKVLLWWGINMCSASVGEPNLALWIIHIYDCM